MVFIRSHREEVVSTFCGEVLNLNHCICYHLELALLVIAVLRTGSRIITWAHNAAVGVNGAGSRFQLPWHHA